MLELRGFGLFSIFKRFKKQLPCINLAIGEGSDKEISTKDNVQYTRHQQFNQLRGIDDLAANLLTKHNLKFYINIAEEGNINFFVFNTVFFHARK